jgi:penicillin-binding protein 1A
LYIKDDIINFMKNAKLKVKIHLGFLFFFAIFFGAALGFLLSETTNIENVEYFQEIDTALPSKIVDVNGELITELTAEEKREIISYDDLPQLLIDALITREDRVFFAHDGFTFKSIMRAVIGVLTRKQLGGGSTLTQQIAGSIYCDRTDMSVKRKIKELWWAVQMERRYSKNEILELYLNKIYLGGGCYGVSAASKYYFGHDATQLTPAEAALLVIQLSSPSKYNPFEHPDTAMERQQYVLEEMTSEGYITKAEAEESFEDYWGKFDFTRTSNSFYMMRDDKAPWFSEYVRRELGNLIYGSDDIYSSGFTVNTTLNLAHQKVAEEVMAKYIEEANRRYKNESSMKTNQAYYTYIPMAELVAELFGIPGLNLGHQRSYMRACSRYVSEANPILDVVTMLSGADAVKPITYKGVALAKEANERTTVEGTMISIDNETGYINALVGGSKYGPDNEYIRATQAPLQPGSTFKAIYYSAAIDSRLYTPATIISDTPVVFVAADGQNYIPQNYGGKWNGNVCVYYALIHSLNVPSIKILDAIGFDAAIDRAIALLGIPEKEVPYRNFEPVYPLGLGSCDVKPIELARAFAIYANGGKIVTPIAIRNVLDKNGDIFDDPEQRIKDEHAAMGEAAQIISPQTAFVMTKMLEMTVHGGGTLANVKNALNYTNSEGRQYSIPSAGKTGTTQNWADAWACGFTPYYTAAFWFGFDRRGQSLGLSITGSSLCGPAWGEFFHEIHADLPVKQFPVPEDGVSQATVCRKSGLLATKDCDEGTATLWFLSGTVPGSYCNIHTNHEVKNVLLERIEHEHLLSGIGYEEEIDDSPLSFDLDETETPAVPTNKKKDEEEEDSFDNFLID